MTCDPAIRWQTMRDVLDAPEEDWQAERSRVEFEGWGGQLLRLQHGDGQWAGGSFLPAGFERKEWEACGQPWTATSFVLTQLRELGLDPTCKSARRTVDLVGRNARWEEGGQRYWEGETEECINGRTVADGSYFGVDVSNVVERLLGQRQPDGGWNCERCNGSVHTSFASTINVLEGLLEYERASGGVTEVREAREGAENYLLKRRLFRRLSTGLPADPRFLELLHPSRWRYDILRALDYFREAALFAGRLPDARLNDAADHLRERRREDGRWQLDWQLPGRVWFDVDGGVGQPSPWITLKAMRVLKWLAASSSPVVSPAHSEENEGIARRPPEQ